ncbi:uncharacterized protein LOC122333456 isoform X2 [Puntigrus tetrazona]|uniref:uncharacterized protein LOC122333456 isoform X2 n=1 Tax=Puntigrus tetrazona TaxID=1606681 RepID=UPI001C8997E0|nr:uncharacterized protein LOC122333456 isoform X2 [Puntigrus tetrazona]
MMTKTNLGSAFYHFVLKFSDSIVMIISNYYHWMLTFSVRTSTTDKFSCYHLSSVSSSCAREDVYMRADLGCRKVPAIFLLSKRDQDAQKTMAFFCCRSQTMDANTAKMIVLLWTATAVSEAGGDSCTISCADVTGAVHEALTLTCRILLNHTKHAVQCCIKSYMFKDQKGTGIYKKELPIKTCEREINATCVYTPRENRTADFTIFVQTSCETKTTIFTVNVTESGGAVADTVEKGIAYHILLICHCLLLQTEAALRRLPGIINDFRIQCIGRS